MIYRASVLISLMVLSLFGRAGAQETDAERVRKVLKLPRMSSQFNINSQNYDDEVALFAETKGYERQIKELQKQMETNKSSPNLWLQLGDIHTRNGSTSKAKSAYMEVETLLRPQLNTNNVLPAVERAKQMALLGTVLGKLGTAHEQPDKLTEAEKLLRDAVKLAPKEWSVWRDLGKYLSTQFMTTLYDKSQRPDKTGTFSVASPERSARTLKLTAEVLECMDRAVILAPQQSEIYMERSTLRSTVAGIQHMAQLTLPSSANGAEIFQVMFKTFLDPKNRQDLQNASLRGETAFLKGTPALYDVMLSAVDYAQKTPNLSPNEGYANFYGKNYSAYSEATRDTAEKAVTALSKFASTDPKQKALAEALRGSLLLMMGQRDQGLAQSRAALKERPAYTLLMNMIINLALSEKNLPLLEEVFNEALKTSDTPRNRISLAKVYQNTGRQKEKAQQVELALKKDGKDLLALLSAATLAFQSDRAANFSKAVGYLKQVDSLPNKDPDLHRHYEILRAVQWLVLGNKEECIERIQAVLTADKDNEQARDVLIALKQP